nr:retrovirus-related Pol polyprotein from transposon TNT 1-94 [Tanacetum cinerariifolium]
MPLGGHFKLSLKDCSVRNYDVERMSKVPYANAIGSLMYLMVCTRPDIAYVVSVVSRYLANPGFIDSDYAKDPNKGRSITSYVFLVQGCVVSWKATLQHVVALSTTEAEYMALTEAVKEDIWLRRLLEELGVELNTVAVNCDNRRAIHLSRNHVFHEKTKHINVRYHFIREVLKAKTVNVLKVGTEHNSADALTKVVPGLKLQHCLELLNVDAEESVAAPEICYRRWKHRCGAQKVAATAAQHLVFPEYIQVVITFWILGYFFRSSSVIAGYSAADAIFVTDANNWSAYVDICARRRMIDVKDARRRKAVMGLRTSLNLSVLEQFHVVKLMSGGGVWRDKWGPLVAESRESGGWEEEVWWCDGGERG